MIYWVFCVAAAGIIGTLHRHDSNKGTIQWNCQMEEWRIWGGKKGSSDERST